jgi:NADPH:quinone reductase-like Zn-dependent oxidoreductase
MLAVFAASQSTTDPLSGLVVGERPEPQGPGGATDWVTVDVRTSGLNHHDVWSLKGVGLPAERLPMILGCDAAGVDPEGNEVIVHSVIATPEWKGDETLDPRRSLLSEVHDGTLAERVAVPRGNLVPKPAGLSWEAAACLSTAWLTAYRMLFVNSGVRPGGTILVQGAGGGVATALIQLGSAAGYRVWVTARDEAKGERARAIGADRVFGSGERLPERVDAVMETVGAATWSHSINALNPGGTIVISGATSGDAPAKAELTKIFFKQLRVIGSTMGTRQELAQLAQFVVQQRLEPVIDSVMPLADARDGFARMVEGDVFGKIIFTVS